MSRTLQERVSTEGGVHRRSKIWRADLIRVLSTLPPSQAESAARLCGFVAIQQPPETHAPKPAQVPSVPDIPTEIRAAPTAPLPLWRLEEMTFSATANDDLTLAPATRAGLTAADVDSSGRSLLSIPRSPPLAPWSRLWPVLRSSLQGHRRGRDPDIAECLRRWGRGEVMHDLPRVQRPVWADHVELWIDRSQRLAPFWLDEDDVYRRLRRCIGPKSVRLHVLDAETQAQSFCAQGDFLPGLRPARQQRVLVLGDVGAYADKSVQLAWLRSAQRLRCREAQVSALVPAPPRRIPASLARAWSVTSWERGHLARRMGLPRDPQQETNRATRLLSLCSPAAYVPLGLLRALRKLLPASETDAAMEADAFTHSAVQAADALGLVLSPVASAALRIQFVERESPALQTQVSALIQAWSRGLPSELLRIATLTWLGLRSPAQPPGDADDALAFAERWGATLQQSDRSASEVALVEQCARAFLSTLPDRALQTLRQLQSLFAGVYADASGIRVPKGLSPDALYGELVWAEDRTWWSLRHVGSDLIVTRAPSPAWPSADPATGSPVAWLLARGPQVFVKGASDSHEVQYILRDGLRLRLPTQQPLILRTDCSQITLTPWSREPWAVAAGRDPFGLWAEAEVEGIPLRFRWIPPGRFLMGSPEGETGRFDHEGPQHEVTLTQGYWLADAPCTQALWQAVMGNNPSHIQSPDRPVAEVSWDDSQEFVQRLNHALPGLSARLPSEAEWEHACRAGTQTATWLGDLEILGENNAPLLDPIAWYGGNSGQDYELDEGYESSNWPNKQYAHSKAGTHPVRRKAPNPMGLFDVLGNVYEWCMDWYTPYSEEAITNPVLPSNGGHRVVRGGSWNADARNVRAASRDSYPPDFRYVYLGFRLARGQGSSQAGMEAEPRSGAARPAAGRGRASSGSRDATQTTARSADHDPKIGR